MYYKDMLLSVSRPSRYIGGEVNSVKKDLSRVKTKVALIFPDTYEVGMSHLGLKILYQILNNMEDVAAERAFVPWIDLEEVLRNKNLPLVSLESSLPLSEFDIIGFTLPYELSYTNILTTLSLSGIPLLSAERNERHPLVIGGGTAVFNPEPVADFFDAFFLGDGEEGVVDIIQTFKAWKGAGESKKSLLQRLAGIEGVYIPSFYDVRYNSDGTINSINPREGIRTRVKRRIIEDLDKAPFPVSPPLPYMQAIHDRLTVEIARGCTHGCRFCQAGITYRPVRERSPRKILEIMDSSLQKTGYEGISLSSLSAGDFACLSNLLVSLTEKYREEHVALSLPSLRIGTLTPAIIDHITESKNVSFTIAPEAGTERLRKVINKEMDEGVFEATIDDVFRKGVKSIKMYFMIGLPTEDEGDLDGIVALAKRAKDIGRRYGKSGRNITVSVSTFVPKSHTPFQWYGQDAKGEIERKVFFLKDGLKRIGVSFKWHRTEMSYLEAVLSRGDRRLGKGIEGAWRAGCRFDSWTERLDFNRWEEAFKRAGIDPDFYAAREIPLDEILPWDHLDTGVTKEFLIKEYKRAVSCRVIPDCRYGLCPNCGLCDMEAVRGQKDEGIRPIARIPGEVAGITGSSGSSGDTILNSGYNSTLKNPIELSMVSPELPKKLEVGGQKYRHSHSALCTPFKLRVKYAKTGDLRMISQLEIMTVFTRALRRASIPTLFSEGFHPHPKISFGPALPVGIEGICEYFDLELRKTWGGEEFMEEMNRRLPEGLEVLSVKELPYDTPSLNSFIKFYAYEIWGLKEGWGDFFELSKPGELWTQRVIEKDGKRIIREIDTRPFIEDIRWTGKGSLFILLKSRNGECCRPSDVINALFKVSPSDPGIRIRRTGLYGKIDGGMVSPEDPLTLPSPLRGEGQSEGDSRIKGK